jgi:hypothetical protein
MKKRPMMAGEHQPKVEPTASGRRFKASCSCGWNSGSQSPTRATEREAIRHAAYHLQEVEKWYRDTYTRNGVERPRRELGPPVCHTPEVRSA